MILLFFIILLCLLIFILMFRIEIKFVFNYVENKISFNVYIFKFDLSKFKKKEVQKNKSKSQISAKLFLEILNRIKFLKKQPVFIIENILEFGLDESDMVGILYGYISMFTYSLISLISRYVNLKDKKICIIPRYNINFFKFYFKGILKIRIAQIIYISFLFITLGRKLNGTTSD